MKGGLFMAVPVKFDLLKNQYGRRGSFWFVCDREKEEGRTTFLCGLLNGLNSPCPRDGNIFSIALRQDGAEIPYTSVGTPQYVEMTWKDGSARILIQNAEIMRLESKGNIQIVLKPLLQPHEIAKSRNDGSWEVCFAPAPKVLVYPVRGTMEVVTGFDVINSVPGETSFTFVPNADGIIDIALHMYKVNSFRLYSYPSFEECLNEIGKEFDAFLETAPLLPEAYKALRAYAAYMVWSHIMCVDGCEIIYMNKGIHKVASTWQQSHQAIGQYRNPELAWALMESVFHFQDESGMVPDGIHDMFSVFSGTKPPFVGVAWQFLREYTDFSMIPEKRWHKLYQGLRELVYWWLSFRDTDHDMLLQYDAADESGWDDSSMFAGGVPLSTPDLSTYMILAMEALSQMAGHMGRTFEERDWKQKSEEILQKMLDSLWDGRQFVTRLTDTGEVLRCESIMRFLPLLLGQRLPKAVIDAMVSELKQEGGWLTPYGLAGERLSSPRCNESGWSSGPVLAPTQLLICLGLRACGEDDLAAEITHRYINALINSNFAMVMSPTSGKDVSEGRWSNRYPNRMSWTCLIFLVLGSLYLVS